MNRLPLSSLFLVPMFFAVGVVAFLSLLYALRDRFGGRPSGVERLYRCSVCGHVYVDARVTGLARCTRCGCLNEPLHG